MPVHRRSIDAIRQPAFLYGPDGRIAATNDLAEALAGLPLVRRDVERHGGRCWVESVPGEGTAFLFTLPPA